MTAELIAEGRAALRGGDALAARAVLERAEPSPEVLEVLASASFVLLEYDRSLHEMESAYAGYRGAGDSAGAARVARMLGGMHGSTSGDWAVASGWIARAKTLLGDGSDTNEAGWVALTEGMFEADRTRKNTDFQRAVEIGRRTDDPDLAFAAVAYLGASLVHDDRTEEGMLLLDEACAAVAGSEVDSFMVVEEIFCQLFSACEHAHDVRRADQWIRLGERVAEQRRLPAVSAYCHTHYGGILTAAGRWPEADAALTAAVRLWALGRRTLQAGALARLADLRMKQGRYDEAAALLDGLTDNDSVQPRAALHLARGEYAVAVDLLEHAVRRADPRTSACLPLLALLVDAQLATGKDPQPMIEAMATCADEHPSPYANALVALARGRAGDGDPKRWLREALDGFNQSQLPLEASLCRLDLARACSQDNPEVAVAEARNALRSFEMLQAAQYVDAATAVLRQLGQKVRPPAPSGNPLSRREEDVLRLLGEGLSNPEISERLFISRKTVEHHVGNILVKLGLRNRAEAAAYAVRREPAPK
ncbi:LuxR C-terminal-related transcriptional regulator [Kribbella sp. NPDC050124]|uniref:helix-turn-helix transcriptional regulator n=1 Tax=Kribbella sp. NPDC050124 TaxID=3364114 RepID=UPI0037BD77AE